jgi:rubrerythrin
MGYRVAVMKNTTLSTISLATAAFFVLLPGVAEAKVSEQTLKNLNTAYQGESNAANRYAKFAEKALADGNAQAGKLFRAASAAEAIHRDTHLAAIKELEGTPATFQLEAVAPGTTAENLRAAIAGETHERDVMYPEFIATAKADDARPAIRTLEFALAAEKEHAKLYQNMLDTLGQPAAADYYVCQVCGMTLMQIPAKKCPSCHKSRDNYKKIN